MGRRQRGNGGKSGCVPPPPHAHTFTCARFFFPLQDDASVVSLIADATAELERYGATNGVVVAKCRHRQRRRQRRRQRQRQRQRDHTHSFTHSLFHRFSSWFTTPCLPPPTTTLLVALGQQPCLAPRALPAEAGDAVSLHSAPVCSHDCPVWHEARRRGSEEVVCEKVGGVERGGGEGGREGGERKA